MNVQCAARSGGGGGAAVVWGSCRGRPPRGAMWGSACVWGVCVVMAAGGGCGATGQASIQSNGAARWHATRRGKAGRVSMNGRHVSGGVENVADNHAGRMLAGGSVRGRRVCSEAASMCGSSHPQALNGVGCGGPERQHPPPRVWGGCGKGAANHRGKERRQASAVETATGPRV